MKERPKYYSYMVIFRGETEDVQPIIGVSDLEKLRLENQGRMHLLDDRLFPVLSAVEYCLHMPRTEMDTYDVDTRVLDNAYDVPHNICIIPDTVPFIEQIMPQFTFIIYEDNCLDFVKESAQSSETELEAMPVSDLSNELLKDHWNALFIKRKIHDVERLRDIEKQFLLSDDKQLILPALATARQYGNADIIYNKVFNSVNIFETCADVIWNQLVHHNALMACSSFSGTDGNLFRTMFREGEKRAENTTRVNVVITMPGVPRRQVRLGGLNQELPVSEKKVIRLMALHRAIAKEALIIEVPLVGNALFDKLNELEINCKQGTNNKYINKTLRDLGKIFEKKLTKEQFKPGEITPEEANRLGYELAMHFTKGNHAFTVSTHTDRAHIHNHIIFNSTTLDCSRKFKNFFFSGIALQRLSDIVCFEHGYSIIERKPYADRTKRTEYPKRHTVRNEIRSVLDDLIRRKPKDWEDFLRLLAEEGYEIKRGKNIAIKGRAQQRFVRLKSLGEDYTEDTLKEKISCANVRDSHRQTQQPGIDLLIDIQNRALGKGAGYERWAKGFNLKQTAKTLLFLQQHDIHSHEELERMTNEAVTGADQLLASIKEKDARIKEIEAFRQQIFDYSKTRKIYLEYKWLPKAKKAEFYELYRAEIELQEAARAAFDQLPEGTKLPTVKELNAERTRLIQERQAEYAEYRKVKTDRTEFIRAKQNADVILNRQAAVRDDRQID